MGLCGFEATTMSDHIRGLFKPAKSVSKTPGNSYHSTKELLKIHESYYNSQTYKMQNIVEEDLIPLCEPILNRFGLKNISKKTYHTLENKLVSRHND